MLRIEGCDIYLTRGDDATISVSITNEAGTAYTVAEGDTLTLAVGKYAGTEAVLVKTAVGTNEIKLDSEDTAALQCRDYVYDVVLTRLNGDRHTVIGIGKDSAPKLHLLPEATNE